MAETRHQIGFEQAGLGSILRQNQLVVPVNQREYAWTQREVKRLFTDFARAVSDRDDYFLGTIVTIPRSDGTLEVVDGQQRLATTALFLAAIRDYLKGMNENFLVESIENEFLTGIDRVQRARVPKMKLNVSDNDLFSTIIVEGVTSGELRKDGVKISHERLVDASREARQYVRTVVASFDAKDHGDTLNEWVSFIEHRALTVLLRVPDTADAYKMFETLNDRGLRTSQADLIKNYLFGRAGERLPEVQDRWSHMRGALESLEDDDITTVTFLRHALMVTGGFLREADVYDRVQSSVKSESSSVQFGTSLESLASAYVASFNPEHSRWNEYPVGGRRSIEVLNLLNIKPMRPLLLSLTEKMSINETVESFRLLIALGVRLLIASSTRSGSIEELLATTANEVYDGRIVNAKSLKARLDAIVPKDKIFQQAFKDARVSNAKFARYYLRSLELVKSGQSEPWYIPTEDGTVINLEHVLPKKTEGNWPDFSDEDVRLWSPRLGNLVLLRASDNSAAKSDGFDQKKAIYASSPYQLTSEVADVVQWTPDDIASRQERLASLALTAWKY